MTTEQSTESVLIRKSSASESSWPRIVLEKRNQKESKRSRSESSTIRLADDSVNTSALVSPDNGGDAAKENWNDSVCGESIAYSTETRVRFCGLPDDNLVDRLERMRVRYEQEKQLRRRKDRALVKLAKELSKRTAEAFISEKSLEQSEQQAQEKSDAKATVLHLRQEVLRLQLSNDRMHVQLARREEQMKIVLSAVVTALVSFGCYVAMTQCDVEGPSV